MHQTVNQMPWNHRRTFHPHQRYWQKGSEKNWRGSVDNFEAIHLVWEDNVLYEFPSQSYVLLFVHHWWLVFSAVASLTQSHGSVDSCIPLTLSRDDFMSSFRGKTISIKQKIHDTLRLLPLVCHQTAVLETTTEPDLLSLQGFSCYQQPPYDSDCGLVSIWCLCRSIRMFYY